MRNIKVISIFLITIIFFSSGILFSQSEKELFSKAKLFIFDKEWENALNSLNQLLKKFPESKYKDSSSYYRAKSLIELNKVVEALKELEKFINSTKNKTLKEDALIDILKINFSQYKKSKNNKYLNKVLKYLDHDNDFIRFYLAFELSYLTNKKIAQKAVPILKQIISEEADSELNDRAKLALMRINPRFLKETSKKSVTKNAIFKITVFDKANKKMGFELSIPFTLAKMALSSLPAEIKEEFAKEGIKTDKILHEVIEQREIFKFESGEALVKIWIENKK